MKRILFLLLSIATGAVAAPSDADFVQDLYARWYVPRSAEFAVQSHRLAEELQGACETAPRAQWLLTVASWERFSAVRGGALLARRSPREIDFLPTRPDAIVRAIRSAPRDAAAMDRIGSPAKGLPALEWLLWTQPLGTDACRYARQAAIAVADEADALESAYRRRVSQGWDAREAEYAMYEFLNLWDAGLQKLWWEEMDRPAQKARDGRAPALSRATSGHVVDGWRLQWQALRALGVGEDVSIGRHLRDTGHADTAQGLASAVAAVDRAMASLADPGDATALQVVVAKLKDLQQFAEGDMATALHFVISFFDEDGD